jgi:two-component system alkaline phosphatase synthesis response regulator PhoP
MQGHILIVEDEEAIAAFVQTALEREGFTTQWVGNGPSALSAVQTSQPDLVVLDLMLPGMDGLQVCQKLRQREPYIPIIMLTARAEAVDKIVGLEVGADDYVTKPFNARELVARVRAILRLAGRSAGQPPAERLRFGQLEIDLGARQVQVAGRLVELAPKEFDLLAVLARNPGRVLGRETLLEQVWGYDFLGDSRTVDVHMQRLRYKIEDDPHEPRYLLTVRSIGYRFAAD